MEKWEDKLTKNTIEASLVRNNIEMKMLNFLEEAHLRAQTYLRYEKPMGDKRKSDQQATRFHCQVVRKRQRKDC